MSRNQPHGGRPPNPLNQAFLDSFQAMLNESTNAMKAELERSLDENLRKTPRSSKAKHDYSNLSRAHSSGSHQSQRRRSPEDPIQRNPQTKTSYPLNLPRALCFQCRDSRHCEKDCPNKRATKHISPGLKNINVSERKEYVSSDQISSLVHLLSSKGISIGPVDEKQLSKNTLDIPRKHMEQGEELNSRQGCEMEKPPTNLLAAQPQESQLSLSFIQSAVVPKNLISLEPVRPSSLVSVPSAFEPEKLIDLEPVQPSSLVSSPQVLKEELTSDVVKRPGCEKGKQPETPTSLVGPTFKPREPPDLDSRGIINTTEPTQHLLLATKLSETHNLIQYWQNFITGHSFKLYAFKLSTSSLMHLFCPISAQEEAGVMEKYQCSGATGALNTLEIKEKSPDTCHQTPKKITRGNYLDSQKRMKPNLLSFGTGQTVLKTRFYETREYDSATNPSNYHPQGSENRRVTIVYHMEHEHVLIKDKPPDTLFILRTNYKHQQGKPLNLPSEFWYAVSSCDAGYGKYKEEIQLRQHQPRRVPTNHEQSVRNGWTPEIIIRARDKEHELDQISIYTLKEPFIDHTDIIRLFLSKRSNSGYGASLKRPRRTTRREEDNRFKPPNLEQDKHQDVRCFIMVKEAPPDATYKSKPNLNIQGKYNLSSSFKVTDLVSLFAGKTDLRTNPFQVGEDDVILTSKATKETKEQEEQLGPEKKRAKKQLVAEEIQEQEPEAAHLPFGSIKPKTKEASKYTTFFKTKTRAILSLLIQPPWF